METLEERVQYCCPRLLERALSSEKRNSTGYPRSASPNASYVTLFKMSSGSIAQKGLDAKMQIALARDHCLCSDAYMGEVNLIDCGGHSGHYGALWGYDLVQPAALEQQRPLFTQKRSDGSGIAVYDMEPLLTATERLLGYARQRRFALKPGSHVMAHVESSETGGPHWLWALMAVAIPRDRRRHSCYIMQDSGAWGGDSDNESDMIGFLSGAARGMAHAIAIQGEASGADYERIYLGRRYTYAEPGELACIMACAPAVCIAQNAVPSGSTIDELQNFSLENWERSLHLPNLE